MQTIVSQLDEAFRAAIGRAFDMDADPLIGPAQNEKFGDYQSNAAMGLAKQLAQKTGEKTKPRAVAEQIKANLALGEMASEVSIAGPGFINVRLSPTWLAARTTAVAKDPRLGVDAVAAPQTVVIDYSSPNVAKQMHVGHLRSTIIGDSMARVLEFHGDRVIRQNHVGDWGTQFGMLIAHVKSQDDTGQVRIADLDRFYKEARARFDADPAFADESRATVVRLQAGADEELRLWRRIVEESRRHFQPIYDRLHIRLTPADERGESFYNPLLPAVVADLKSTGQSVESDGAAVVFTEGDEAPLIIEKSGGGFGYATTDLAAIRYRTGQLGAGRIVYVVGTPQSQHFRQVFKAARAAGWAGDARLEHAAFGSVLGEDGKMFKARSGDSVKLADLLDEAEERAFQVVTQESPELPEDQRRAIARAIGIGAVKYADLSKDRIGDYVFSWDQMLSLKGNSAPYLQYAHARVRAIFRKAAERGITFGGAANARIELQSPFELALAKQILRFGEVVDLVARELKPHHLCAYLYELATRYSGFYENCPVLQSDEQVRSSRLALVELTARTIATGLDLLGIEHPDQM
jgi:arginyl-tRNA synthetase